MYIYYKMIKSIIFILFVFLILNNSFLNEKFTQKEKLDVAVIVEPREHKYLIPVVLNFIENLPNETQIQIFHGTKNINFIKNGLNKYIKSGKIKMNNLGKENIDRNYYSDMFTSSEFWHKIKGENILIFQTDSCLCSKPLKNINYYVNLGYGYIGGPLNEKYIYQNGGFSLRKKSKMLEAINTKKKGENTWPCDKWFSVNKKNIVNPAPINIAKDFAIERVFSKGPIGVHKPWSFLKKKELNELKKNCPEINKIFGK